LTIMATDGLAFTGNQCVRDVSPKFWKSGRAWIVFACLFLSSYPAPAVEVAGLYRAETIVTGTGEPERTRGLRIGLGDVIVKVTGDTRLRNSPVIAPLLADPRKFVADFEYEDRKKGIPIHDEQGTRDRSHYLRIVFKAAEIDRAISELGLRIWPSSRPLIAVWLLVRPANEPYVLRAAGPRGYGQRSVLEAASRRFGIPMRLPPADGDWGAITIADVASQNIDKIRKVVAGTDAEAQLLGQLTLGPKDYWDISWTLYWNTVPKSWSHKNVTFDVALKDGLQHSAPILSNNVK